MYTPLQAWIDTSAQLKSWILEKTQESLSRRAAGNRSESDDMYFGFYNNTIQRLIGSGDHWGSLGADIFIALEEKILDFEKEHNIDLHKGSMYFNGGLCFLKAGDFEKALYYWTLADIEDQLTCKKAPHALFFNDIFNQNFGSSVRFMLTSEIEIESKINKLITGSIFDYIEYEKYLRTQQNHNVINLMIIYYRRIIYDSFANNDATKILYCKLVSDSCILFENNCKEFLSKNAIPSANSLGGILFYMLGKQPVGDISTLAKVLKAKYKCETVEQYNNTYSLLLKEIDSETDRLAAIAKILYLITATRNQLAHKITPELCLYNDIEGCKRIIRFIFIAQQFNKYLL